MYIYNLYFFIISTIVIISRLPYINVSHLGFLQVYLINFTLFAIISNSTFKHTILNKPKDSLMIINAEKIKDKGVSLFKKILITYDEVIINFRGENKYVIIDIDRYLHLEDYKNKIISRKKHPQFIPEKFTFEHLQKSEEKLIKYDAKIDKIASKMRTDKKTITANDIKINGVSFLDDFLEIDNTVVINVNGKSKYIALKIEEYKKLLTTEQNFMYKRAISQEERFEIRLAKDDDTNDFMQSLLEQIR